MSNTNGQLPELDLQGMKVWLSGAIPEPDVENPDVKQVLEAWAGSELERGILGFVQEFSSLVFKFGGEIVHGCHPSFTPILLECARGFADVDKEKSLHLCVSKFWNEENAGDWDRWQKNATLTTVERTGTREEDRDPSLALLREQMADSCNAFVAIGGKWWSDVPGRAGIPKEFELAKSRNVPCFILGGFGGASRSYMEDHPDWIDGLNNGLSHHQNREIAISTNFVLAAGRLVAQLHLLNTENGGSNQAMPAN